MEKRLRINLPPWWSDYSDENPDGPPIYLSDESEVPGPLQVSCAWYESGEVPNPTDDQLIEMAKGIGKMLEGSELVETSSGSCAIGRYGTAIFRSSDSPRAQAWYLTNGRDIVTVTHIAAGEPESDEIRDAQDIVEAIEIVEGPDEPA